MESKRGKQRSAHSMRKQQRKLQDNYEEKKPNIQLFSNGSDLDTQVAALWLECSNYVCSELPVVFKLDGQTITSCMDEPTLRARVAIAKRTVNTNPRTAGGRANIEMLNKCQYVLDHQETFCNLMKGRVKEREAEMEQIHQEYGENVRITIEPGGAKKVENLDLIDEEEKTN